MEGAALEALRRFQQRLLEEQETGIPMEFNPADVIGLLCYIFDRGPGEKERLVAAMSQVDREINEIYHEIEASNFNAAEGYRLAKRLQLKLRERRQIKIDLQIMQRLAPFLETHRDRVLAIGEKSYRDLAERDKWYQEGTHDVS